MPDRRFSDTLPALDDITNSDWDTLSGEARSDLLRRRHAQVIEVLRLNVDATHDVAKQLNDDLGPLLAANTAATARTEAKVDASVKSLELLVERTERPLALWGDIEGAGSLIGRIGSFLKNAAWFAIPIGFVIGGGKALIAYLTGPGPKP